VPLSDDERRALQTRLGEILAEIERARQRYPELQRFAGVVDDALSPGDGLDRGTLGKIAENLLAPVEARVKAALTDADRIEELQREADIIFAKLGE
jgi:hypothetical protein